MSTNVQHTPGPWRMQRGSHQYADCVTILAAPASASARHPRVCKVYPEGYGGPTSPITVPHEANARLIAASPALLAACENSIQIIEQLIPEPSARGVADVVLSQLRAAIASARGK